MKYVPLVWAALWRRKARTIFTLLSIMVAFLLFGMLQGVNSAFNQAVEQVADAARLLLGSLVTLAPPKDREEEKARLMAASAKRFAPVRQA